MPAALEVHSLLGTSMNPDIFDLTQVAEEVIPAFVSGAIAVSTASDYLACKFLIADEAYQMFQYTLEVLHVDGAETRRLFDEGGSWEVVAVWGTEGEEEE